MLHSDCLWILLFLISGDNFGFEHCWKTHFTCGFVSSSSLSLKLHLRNVLNRCENIRFSLTYIKSITTCSGPSSSSGHKLRSPGLHLDLQPHVSTFSFLESSSSSCLKVMATLNPASAWESFWSILILSHRKKVSLCKGSSVIYEMCFHWLYLKSLPRSSVVLCHPGLNTSVLIGLDQSWSTYVIKGGGEEEEGAVFVVCRKTHENLLRLTSVHPSEVKSCCEAVDPEQQRKRGGGGGENWLMLRYESVIIYLNYPSVLFRGSVKQNSNVHVSWWERPFYFRWPQSVSQIHIWCKTTVSKFKP